jgi:hypothetical protein
MQPVPMKAYDVQKLVEQLKSVGLNAAEDGAKGVVSAVFSWVKDSVKESPTPFDDIVLVVLPKLEEQIYAAIDKIDGVQG